MPTSMYVHSSCTLGYEEMIIGLIQHCFHSAVTWNWSEILFTDGFYVLHGGKKSHNDDLDL